MSLQLILSKINRLSINQGHLSQRFGLLMHHLGEDESEKYQCWKAEKAKGFLLIKNMGLFHRGVCEDGERFVMQNFK